MPNRPNSYPQTEAAINETGVLFSCVRTSERTFVLEVYDAIKDPRNSAEVIDIYIEEAKAFLEKAIRNFRPKD